MNNTDIQLKFDRLKETASLNWKQLMMSSKPVIMVGTATCGRAAGSLEVVQAFKDEISRQGIECPVVEVGCMGHCYAEPLAVIYKPDNPAICYSRLNPVIAQRLVSEYIMGNDWCLDFVLGALQPNELVPALQEFPRSSYEHKLLLKNCGFISPVNIDHYIASGGYSALSKALQLPRDSIIEQLMQSGLRGRGGAGFLTGEKWRICRDTKGTTKYLICNGDEGDPGAFMDRSILESDPHSVLEGMIIAAYTVGARHGYF